jgi:hypothetical protein
LIIILLALRVGGNYVSTKKFAPREFIFNMWFMPFLFRGTLTRYRLTRGKTFLFLREGGWGIILGPKVFLGASEWAINYLFFSFGARFLKRLIFIVRVALIML